MDDPGPEPNTIGFIIVFALLALFSFVVTLGASAAESANDKKLREAADDKDKRSVRLLKLIDGRPKPADVAGVCTILAASFGAAAAIVCFLPYFSEKLSHWSLVRTFPSRLLTIVLPAVIIGVVVCVLFSVFGVILPRRIGAQNSDKTARSLSGFLLFIKVLFFPLTWLVCGISGILVKLFGGDPLFDEVPVTEDEILSMVDEGVIEESQKEMISNIFEFDDLVASDVMTHRTSIVAVEASEDMGSMIATAIEEGYSRLPVYEDELDNIKGLLYVKDLLKYVGTSIPADMKPSDIMREAMFIPESKKCGELFSEMTEKHLQMVIVSDEYGGVAGIVTIEDLLESIVGSIQDEFDDETEDFKQISETTFYIDGTSDIHEVEELLGLQFPEGEYDTVAGYIMSVIGRIPDPDEHPVVEYGGYSFTVAEMEERRIVRVIAEKLPEPDAEETE